MFRSQSSLSWGVVWAFNGHHRARDRILGMPGVDFVDYDHLIPSGTASSSESWLDGALPLEVGSVTPRDGVISVSAGQTVTARYRAASGEVVESTFSVPQLSP